MKSVTQTILGVNVDPDVAWFADRGIAYNPVDRTYSVPSSDGKRSYVVRFCGRTDDGVGKLWECNCPASRYRPGLCKHAQRVAGANDDLCDARGCE